MTKVRNPAGGPGRARQFEAVGGANLNTFTQQEQEDSAALQPIRTGVFHPLAQLVFALYPDDSMGPDQRGASTSKRQRGRRPWEGHSNVEKQSGTGIV